MRFVVSNHGPRRTNKKSCYLYQSVCQRAGDRKCERFVRKFFLTVYYSVAASIVLRYWDLIKLGRLNYIFTSIMCYRLTLVTSACQFSCSLFNGQHLALDGNHFAKISIHNGPLLLPSLKVWHHFCHLEWGNLEIVVLHPVQPCVPFGAIRNAPQVASTSCSIPCIFQVVKNEKLMIGLTSEINAKVSFGWWSSQVPDCVHCFLSKRVSRRHEQDSFCYIPVSQNVMRRFWRFWGRNLTWNFSF